MISGGNVDPEGPGGSPGSPDDGSKEAFIRSVGLGLALCASRSCRIDRSLNPPSLNHAPEIKLPKKLP